MGPAHVYEDSSRVFDARAAIDVRRATAHALGVLVGVVLPKRKPIFGNVPNGTSHISSTIGVQLENSSDLSLGRRPDSKSDEFSSVYTNG